MDILLHTLSLLTAEEDGMWITKAGFFSDYMNIVAIALIIVGAAIVYFAVKLFKGYSFHAEETVVVDKTEGFEVVNAEIAERRQTEIPNYSASAAGKGNDVFKEMRIVYTVGDTEYSQWISDYGEDMYKDTLPIKYDPENPDEFYVVESDDEFEGIPDENGELDGNEGDGENESPKNGVAVTVLIIGILVLGVGTLILIDWLGGR